MTSHLFQRGYQDSFSKLGFSPTMPVAPNPETRINQQVPVGPLQTGLSAGQQQQAANKTMLPGTRLNTNVNLGGDLAMQGRGKSIPGA